jgi:hypothetical protein
MRLRPLSQCYGCPTTRRHPRSMAEAWPREHANPIEHCPSARSWLASDLVIAAILIGIVTAMIFGAM